MNQRSVEAFANGFPHPFFEWLREEAPVYWHEPTPRTPDGEGFWVVSRYADVLAILRDPTRFSSGVMAALVDQVKARSLDDAHRGGETLLGTDPPRHTRLRKIINRAFTPRCFIRSFGVSLISINLFL